MKKKLLILGAGNAQIDLIEYAKEAGFEIYGCSYTNTDNGIPLLDHFAMIDITDAEKIEKYVMENRMVTVGKGQPLYFQSHISFFSGRNVYFNVA